MLSHFHDLRSRLCQVWTEYGSLCLARTGLYISYGRRYELCICKGNDMIDWWYHPMFAASSTASGDTHLEPPTAPEESHGLMISFEKILYSLFRINVDCTTISGLFTVYLVHIGILAYMYEKKAKWVHRHCMGPWLSPCRMPFQAISSSMHAIDAMKMQVRF